MKLAMAFVLAPALAMLAAPQAAISAPRPAIDGVWKSDCLPIGKNGRHGFIVRLEIKGKQIAAAAQVYAHSSCDMPTVLTEYRGTIAKMRSNGDGSVDFDHVVEAITTTANHPEVVTIYNGNAASGCGFGGGWQLNVARAVDGRTCAPWTFPKAGTRLYERAWVAGDDLRIGSLPSRWDNVTPDKRPTAPGALVFHRVAGRD
jgi:hypothetical protein